MDAVAAVFLGGIEQAVGAAQRRAHRVVGLDRGQSGGKGHCAQGRVGFAQAMLNQGDHWLNHHVDAVVITKSILSPVLACTIALISALTATAAKNSNP